MRASKNASFIAFLDQLESRRLMSTVNVTAYGATGDGKGDDSYAIQRAFNDADAGDTIYFPAGIYNVTHELTLATGRSITGDGETSILNGHSAGNGDMIHITGDNISVTKLTFQGGGLFLDKTGGMNTKITIDNNIFQLNTTGTNPSAITFTSGLASTTISNNIFTGYTGGFGIYGYNYNGLSIHNNEFVDITAGMHIDAFGSSGNLVVQANYVHGAKGMGFEFQGSANNLKFLDNWYDHPNLSTTFNVNNNSFGFSLILDKSSNITIARNAVIAPERPDKVGTRIAFEIGGDNANVYDNYINGVNHVAAMNDGVGTASVVFHDNYMANYLQSPSSSFSLAGVRTFTQYNNGSDVQLSWDINRGHPGINGTYGEDVDLPDGGDTTLPVNIKPPTSLTVTKQGINSALLAWKDNDNDELGYLIEVAFNGTAFREVAFTRANIVKYLATGLKTGSYTFRVRAYNAAGYSTYSNSVTYVMGGSSGGSGTPTGGTGTTGGGGTTTTGGGTTTTTTTGGTTTTTSGGGRSTNTATASIASLVLK